MNPDWGTFKKPLNDVMIGFSGMLDEGINLLLHVYHGHLHSLLLILLSWHRGIHIFQIRVWHL